MIIYRYCEWSSGSGNLQLVTIDAKWRAIVYEEENSNDCLHDLHSVTLAFECSQHFYVIVKFARKFICVNLSGIFVCNTLFCENRYALMRIRRKKKWLCELMCPMLLVNKQWSLNSQVLKWLERLQKIEN